MANAGSQACLERRLIKDWTVRLEHGVDVKGSS
jgi:hypothetical protein